jgi:hypothetical protein
MQNTGDRDRRLLKIVTILHWFPDFTATRNQVEADDNAMECLAPTTEARDSSAAPRIVPFQMLFFCDLFCLRSKLCESQLR